MISTERLNNYKNWFKDYTQQYLNSSKNYNSNFQLKIDHSYRVLQETKYLCNELELLNEEKNLAELLALLHDLGRFEQYDKYRTFSDNRSENHSIIAVNELKKLDVLADLKPGLRDLIYRCILYHNRAVLPENETEKCLFYSKILRDADKLDIYFLLIEYYENMNGTRNTSMELELPNTEGFNYAIFNDIMNEKVVLLEDVKNSNDFKLLQLGWVFDFNFSASYERIKEKEYIKRIIKHLPNTSEINELNDKLHTYINYKLKEIA